MVSGPRGETVQREIWRYCKDRRREFRPMECEARKAKLVLWTSQDAQVGRALDTKRLALSFRGRTPWGWGAGHTRQASESRGKHAKHDFYFLVPPTQERTRSCQTRQSSTDALIT